MIIAIVPAAGRSERMGRPKLILPIQGETVITRVVTTLRQGGIPHVVVVAPPSETPGAVILAKEATTAGAVVVVPEERPPDMRGSFQLGLKHILGGPNPSAVMLAPADSPGITPTLVARLLAETQNAPGAILIPTFLGRRGHPIVIPWDLALQVSSLPLGAGINALVALHASRIVEIEVDEPGTLDDLDTPTDYQRWVDSSKPSLAMPAEPLPPAEGIGQSEALG